VLVRVQGLTSAKAAEVLARVGLNKLKEGKGTNWYLRFAINVFGNLNILFWMGGILCFIAYGTQKSQSDDPSNDNVSFFILSCFGFGNPTVLMAGILNCRLFFSF
jgi:hypothetical protein